MVYASTNHTDLCEVVVELTGGAEHQALFELGVILEVRALFAVAEHLVHIEHKADRAVGDGAAADAEVGVVDFA